METVHLFIAALTLLAISSCCGGCDRISYNYVLENHVCG